MLAITAGAIVAAVLLYRLLRRYPGTAVDGARVWVTQDTHCTALVNYRERRKTVRLGAEVGAKSFPMTIFLTEKLYTDDGEILSDERARVVVERISRGLKQLNIKHEFEGQLHQ